MSVLTERNQQTLCAATRQQWTTVLSNFRPYEVAYEDGNLDKNNYIRAAALVVAEIDEERISIELFHIHKKGGVNPLEAADLIVVSQKKSAGCRKRNGATMMSWIAPFCR